MADRATTFREGTSATTTRRSGRAASSEHAPGPFRGLADRAFAMAFQQIFTFPLLYEDSEVDNQVLGLRPDSRVLSVSGAGCGVAGLLAAHPARIDAVDTNRHHLALTALKVAAARRMSSHDELYQLLGRGRHDHPARILGPLMNGLPAWVGRYWNENHRRFRRNVYGEGLVGSFQKWLRHETGLDAGFLRAMQPLAIEDRLAHLSPVLDAVRCSRLFRVVANSPLFLLGHGINFEQRQRNLRAHQARSMVEVVTAHLERLAYTDLETNWFVWVGLTGAFNHDHPDAVPPYLRAESHRRSREAPTDVVFHHLPLKRVLAAAAPGRWSHFSLCDVLDWMPADTQRRLLQHIAHVGGPGAVVLTRSVEDACVVDRLGLDGMYERLEPRSSEAGQRERTRLYARVGVYRVTGGPNGSTASAGA